MPAQKYSVNQHPIVTVLSWINAGEVAVPEIQRPFVWNTTQVRDFIDSLYQGYPVGYLIAWRNPSVRLKDGTTSQGKHILIVRVGSDRYNIPIPGQLNIRGTVFAALKMPILPAFSQL